MWYSPSWAYEQGLLLCEKYTSGTSCTAHRACRDTALPVFARSPSIVRKKRRRLTRACHFCFCSLSVYRVPLGNARRAASK